MPNSPLNRVIPDLLADLRPDGGGLTDGELLARFLGSRDEEALAALVRRHAALVWGVCRRLLHSHHDAEDAFQATCLVLVRKAANVPDHAVANWLYGVARQTAVRLRATVAKRGQREMQVTNIPEPSMGEVRDASLQDVLDNELIRLPDHYRSVIVLCDLEGMTRKEAARQLVIPEGSVASRLARARAMLAKRLTKRGIVYSGGASAAGLTEMVASADVPTSVVSSTIKAASLLAAGKTAEAISFKVIALAEGVINAMIMTRLKTAGATLLLMLGIAALGGGLFILQTEAAQKVGEKPANPQPAQSHVRAEEEKPADLPATAKKPRWRMDLEGHGGPVVSLAYSPDGQTLASGCLDHFIKLWDLKTGKESATLKGHTHTVHSVAYSPDGKTLASGSGDHTIKLWDLKTGKELATFKGHTNGVSSVAYSPDGKTLASGSGDHTIKLWDVKTGKELATFKGHTNGVSSVAYSPDGKTLATGSHDQTIKLWDVKTAKELATINIPAGMCPVVFSPDGKTLAAGGGNTGATWQAGERNALRRWDVKTGKELPTIEESWDTFSVAYSPDGKSLVLGGGRDVLVLDAATGKELFRLEGNQMALYALAYSLDGKLLASAGKDRTIKVWDMQPLNPDNPVKQPDVAANETVSGQLKPPGATFARLRGPSWLTIKPDGSFTGKPEECDYGVNTWVVSVTRGEGAPTYIELQIKVIGTSIFAENFNSYHGNEAGNYDQWQTGLKTAHSGGVTGWTKAGENCMYAVDRANLSRQLNPQNWAVMIFQDNVITSRAFAGNASGQVYRIDFEASPAVTSDPKYATQAGDKLLIEVLGRDDKVLASHNLSPGAWTGILKFDPGSFQYTGDGSGDVRLRIKPDGPLTSGRFHGAIDNIVVRKINPLKHPDVAANETVSGQLKPPGATFARVAGPGWLTIKPDGGFTGKPDEFDSGVNTWVVSVTKGDAPPTFIQLQIKVIGTSIFVENFNRYSGNQNTVQWQSGLKVAYSGSVPGWTKTGGNAVHAVDRANRAGQSNPENWAVMISQDAAGKVDDVITSGSIAANASGQIYRVDFEASAAVYAATNPEQATQAGDELLIEVLRGDDRVLASHRHSPGAWTGTLQFAAGSFQYTGDGSGDVRLRIKPAGPHASGRFHGAIDNIIVRKAEAKK